MKFAPWALALLLSGSVWSQASPNSLLTKASELFANTNYEATISEIERIESSVGEKSLDKESQGLMQYWKGICYNRIQDFPQAIKSFETALSLGYRPKDIHYEYAQALYASERLKEARDQFKESLKHKFKRGVSLYYMAFISKELGDKKLSYELFKRMGKLQKEEFEEVLQPAEMLIGDLFLEQAEKRDDAFDIIDRIVIPQYEKALSVNEESALAPVIGEKIMSLQRRYDLALFQLRNGRPANYPPYFLWISQEYGLDSNVTFSPANTTISKSRQSSTYYKADVIGRYSYYVDDVFAIMPELRFNTTYYFNRVPEVYRNDNMLLAPVLRTSYEHTYKGRPASFLVDLEHFEALRDVDAKQNLEFSSRTNGLMVGERFMVNDQIEATVRLRHRENQSYIPQSSSRVSSLVLEQVIPMKVHTLFIYSSADVMRVRNSSFDTNALTLRGDLIMARFGNWFAPTIGFGMTVTDPINDRDNRGIELMINPSVRLSKNFKRHWRANLKYDFMQNNSKDKDDFAFKKSITALELEYLF